MAFGFEIEKENYIIFVGFGMPDKVMQTRYYIFDGWADPGQKKKYFGSLDYWSQEMAAHRTTPKFNGMYIRLTKGTEKEIAGEGTRVGELFKAVFDTRICNLEDIENFFKESGIAAHRAISFQKPIKTIWQVIIGRRIFWK